ncbi:glycosyl hydrolase [Salininema proteolyticum]|uniref:Glycosyl hydrolase n=1 Tax=Salininema proteolyticum TaxID=1607685 RepID=A0ABV8TYM6_9ACTN
MERENEPEKAGPAPEGAPREEDSREGADTAEEGPPPVAAGPPGAQRRGMVAAVASGAALLLVAVGFVLGGAGDLGWQEESLEGDGSLFTSPGERVIVPDAATYTASGAETPESPRPQRLPVGRFGTAGVLVAHFRFTVDESMAEEASRLTLELPIAALEVPDRDPMILEIASVDPEGCPCELEGSSPALYGNVWGSAEVDDGDESVEFDLTDAVGGPGRYGFAVTTPDLGSRLHFNGTTEVAEGPLLRVLTPPKTPVRPDAKVEDLPEAAGPAAPVSPCRLGEKLVPTCGVLQGAAAGGHSNVPRDKALRTFEDRVDKRQDIYHAYERGTRRVFPGPEQIDLARDPDGKRILFLNWKPYQATWEEIANGDRKTDEFLDRLAEHIKEEFPEPFFFTVHHEPENDVGRGGKGQWEAEDYAAMFRYVVEYLRAKGVDNIVTVMNYMAYLKWVEYPWHSELYPGDDVVDWIGWSAYGLADRKESGDDLTDLVNRPAPDVDWPGYYDWTVRNHPTKPIMLGEWGVFRDPDRPDHQRRVFEEARAQLSHYPRLKAMVYFESPNAEGRNSEVHHDPRTLESYRELMRTPSFSVKLD